MSVLGADHLTSDGGGGRGDLLLAGNFFLGSLCARYFFPTHHQVRFFFATLSFATVVFQ